MSSLYPFRCDQKTEQRVADEFCREHPGLELTKSRDPRVWKLVEIILVKIILAEIKPEGTPRRLYSMKKHAPNLKSLINRFDWSIAANQLKHNFETEEFFEEFLLNYHHILARRRDRDYKAI